MTQCIALMATTLKKFSPDGELVMILGKKDSHSETGCSDKGFPNFPDHRTIRRSAGPFYFPTDTTVDNDGNSFVSDGYGNARTHKFSRDGELLRSWGEPESGKGRFNLPHEICVDSKGIVYVADRENCRVQLFDSNGKYVDEWNATRPTDVFLKEEDSYVVEMGYPAKYLHVFAARLSILDLDGALVSR